MYGVEERASAIKLFKITKIIFAKSLIDAIKNEDIAEIVNVELAEQIEKPQDGTIGFN